MTVYEPAEDTYLMIESIKLISNHINPKTILDVGTGSGAIAVELKKLFPNARVIATDIDDEAIERAKEEFTNKNAKVEIVKSNIWPKGVKNRFDLITFNPPYLPKDGTTTDIDTATVDNGSIDEFLNTVDNYITEKGIFLILLSDLHPKTDIWRYQIEAKGGFLLNKESLFFENLYVYIGGPRAIRIKPNFPFDK